MLAAVQVGLAVASLVSGGLFSVKGNGKIVEQVRKVSAFTGVNVSNAIAAKVTIGPETSVTLSCDENLLKLIEIKVEQGHLVTRVKGSKGLDPSTEIRLTIVTPTLISVKASGASRVEAETTAAPEFSVDSSGAADVTVRSIASEALKIDASGASTVSVFGTANHIDLEASGASTVKSGEIAAPEVNVEVSGASRVLVHATESLTGKVSGTSELKFTGNPAKHEVDSSGMSSVKSVRR